MNQFYSLFPYPDQSDGQDLKVTSQISFDLPEKVVFSYEVLADLSTIKIPEQTNKSTFLDLLWQHTCFEAFVRVNDEAAYREFNFSPSGHWAIYDFSSYRKTKNTDLTFITPEIDVEQSHNQLMLRASLPLSAVLNEKNTNSRADTSLNIALSTVLEKINTHKSYWALFHPAEKPDFHHPHSFILNIPLRNLL